jgi:hypothetical protein
MLVPDAGALYDAFATGPVRASDAQRRRQGDARGNEVAAIAVLEAGLTRHTDATAIERVPVLVYLAELLILSGDRGRAADVLAELRALELDDAASAEVGEELALAAELENSAAIRGRR